MPFWVVGHIHLSVNMYEDLYEILASCGMNVIVAIGFWLDWKEHKKQTK
jgi:predicted metal-dependent TIM-barrel fold hydrolase